MSTIFFSEARDFCFINIKTGFFNTCSKQAHNDPLFFFSPVQIWTLFFFFFFKLVPNEIPKLIE